jgi:dipeptidyl aminopeptidase/acylaminoacyl peptidase
MLATLLTTFLLLATPTESTQFDAKRLDFTVADHPAFIILPTSPAPDGAKPWVWYAPTFIGQHPDESHTWMAQQFLAAGYAIAGVEVGESYGSPAGTAAYSAFYDHVRHEFGLAERPCLLPQSRGGLMLLNWAAENPAKVARIAGIYTVCNLESYPGVERAADAYKMTPDALRAALKEHNPLDRLPPLAQAKVPVFFIHGDADTVVPLEANAGALTERYRALGGDATLLIIPGKGHEVCPEFFESQQFVDFVLGGPVSPPAG